MDAGSDDYMDVRYVAKGMDAGSDDAPGAAALAVAGAAGRYSNSARLERRGSNMHTVGQILSRINVMAGATM